MQNSTSSKNASSIYTLWSPESTNGKANEHDKQEVKKMLDEMLGVSDEQKARDHDALVRRMMAEMRYEIAEQSVEV